MNSFRLSAEAIVIAVAFGTAQLALILAVPHRGEAAGCSTPSFGAATSFAAGNYPNSVAVGDFNGDGHLDLAVTNNADNTVSVLLGTGSGSFGAATNFGVGSGPTSVTVGDFNGDGRLDLAVANSGNNTVSVLLGTGSGFFRAAASFAVGSEYGAYSVAVGDFNGDGHLDLATANGGDNTVSILPGTGSGSFGGATNFTVGSGPASVAVGDFNGDGHLDLAVTNNADNTVSILLNDCGAPPTATPTPTPTPPPSTTATPAGNACIGDCDGSGDVTVDELITLVNIDLGTADPSTCPHGIPSGGSVNVALIIQAVNSALNGCQILPDLQGRPVTVAVEKSSPPFDYVDVGPEGFGWDYDTVTEICKRLNCVAQFEQTVFQGVFDAVHAGQFDMLADGVTITASRQQLVVFSISYLTVSEVLLVRASEVESLAQFKIDLTRIVGAQAGTTNEQTALATFGAARVLTAATVPQVVSGLLVGSVDGAVLDSVAANVFALGNPGQLETLGLLTSGEQLAFAFPPNSSLVAAVNAALQSMMNDGTLSALNIKWRVVS